VRRGGAAVLAALLCLAVYGRTLDDGFLNYDDPVYVVRNEVVRRGLTWEGVRWAFTSAGYAFNWHPLTWLSHQADVTLLWLRPGGHRAVNLLLHLGGSLLLAGAFLRLTGRGPAALLAGLIFVTHPLHVESVAWIAERKDVLAGALFFLALLLWTRYAARPSPGRYLGAAATFALALLAKPTAVTFPLALLALDWWPLGRLRGGEGGLRRFFPFLVEKLPLLALAALAAGMTLLAQARGGALRDLVTHPFPSRAGNALVAYAAYLGQALWPADLAVFYPYPPGGWSRGPVLAAALLLGGILALAARFRRRLPSLAAGAALYLVLLLPMIGLVQVGSQWRADRYLYLPLVGLLLPLATPPLPGRRRTPAVGTALAVAGATVVALLSLAAFRQAGYWRDSRTLFGRALEVTRDNWLAHGNLGQDLLASGDIPGALHHLGRVAALRPWLSKARCQYGKALAAAGRPVEARAEFEAALAAEPGYAEAMVGLGRVEESQGRAAAALLLYRRALAAEPGHPPASLALADLLWRSGDREGALDAYRGIQAATPDYPEALNNHAAALISLGRWQEAAPLLSRSLELNPDLVTAHFNYGLALEMTGRPDRAVTHYREALRRDRELAPAREALRRLGGMEP
jgi:tetratricopeptide (TPR) repeat protein